MQTVAVMMPTACCIPRRHCGLAHHARPLPPRPLITHRRENKTREDLLAGLDDPLDDLVYRFAAHRFAADLARHGVSEASCPALRCDEPPSRTLQHYHFNRSECHLMGWMRGAAMPAPYALRAKQNRTCETRNQLALKMGCGPRGCPRG